jgi:hypothetical protein
MTTPASSSTKCRHAACLCTVEPSLAYCCEYCAQADQQETALAERRPCECGHPECKQKSG